MFYRRKTHGYINKEAADLNKEAAEVSVKLVDKIGTIQSSEKDTYSEIHPSLADPKPGAIVVSAENYGKLTPEDAEISAKRIQASSESRKKFLAYLDGASVDLKKELRDLYVKSLKEELSKYRKLKPWYRRCFGRISVAIRGTWNFLFGKKEQKSLKDRLVEQMKLSLDADGCERMLSNEAALIAQLKEDCRQGRIEVLPGETMEKAARRVIIEKERTKQYMEERGYSWREERWQR